MNALRTTLALLLLALTAFAQNDQYDVLIKNGTVYDGSGGNPCAKSAAGRFGFGWLWLAFWQS